MVFTGILLAAGPAYAAGPDDIIGVWNTKERDAKIEIYNMRHKVLRQDCLVEGTELSCRFKRRDAGHADARS